MVPWDFLHGKHHCQKWGSGGKEGLVTAYDQKQALAPTAWMKDEKQQQLYNIAGGRKSGLAPPDLLHG